MKRSCLPMLSALLLSAGCCWLNPIPPGTPPPGNIVDNAPPAGELTARAAENYLVASLSVYTLQNMPGALISINADDATRAVAEAVLRNIRPVSAVVIAPDSPLQLRSRAEGNRWVFQLYEVADRTILWQENLAVQQP